MSSDKAGAAPGMRGNASEGVEITCVLFKRDDKRCLSPVPKLINGQPSYFSELSMNWELESTLASLAENERPRVLCLNC